MLICQTSNDGSNTVFAKLELLMMGLMTDVEVVNEYITYCDFKSEGSYNTTTHLLQVVCNEVYTITAAQVPS